MNYRMGKSNNFIAFCTETAAPVVEPEGFSEFLTTGDMARLTGSTLRTIRFYEEEGLIRPETRSEGGHRVFMRLELQKLQLILDLREAGASLQDIKDLFALKSTCTSPENASERMSKILAGRIEDLQKKINTLHKLRAELADSVKVIQECGSCEAPQFPLPCKKCEMLNREDLPRAVRLFWR